MQKQKSSWFAWQKLLVASALLFTLLASYALPLTAQTLTQSYESDETLQRGMIVGLKPGEKTKVEAIGISRASESHGVVVDPNDAPVALSSEGHKVFVATSSRFEVLISTENGVINSGDYITPSSLNGIGMKADENQKYVVGRAVDNFNKDTGAISTATIKNDDGTQSTVTIGRVLMDVNIMRNPLAKPETPNIPEFMRKAAESIAQKEVSLTRVYISIGILLAAAIISGTVLYAGVHSSIISLGRNPLSRRTIMKSLIQVVIISIIVFIVGIFAVYLLLRS